MMHLLLRSLVLYRLRKPTFAYQSDQIVTHPSFSWLVIQPHILVYLQIYTTAFPGWRRR